MTSAINNLFPGAVGGAYSILNISAILQYYTRRLQASWLGHEG